MARPAMNLHERGDAVMASFTGSLSNLDEQSLRNMRDQINAVVDRDRPSHVILDMSDVDYFSTGFVELILQTLGRVRRRGGDLSVQGLNGTCLEVLQHCRLDQIIPLSQTTPPGAWWG